MRQAKLHALRWLREIKALQVREKKGPGVLPRHQQARNVQAHRPKAERIQPQLVRRSPRRTHAHDNHDAYGQDHIGPQVVGYSWREHRHELLQAIAGVLSWRLSLCAAERLYKFSARAIKKYCIEFMHGQPVKIHRARRKPNMNNGPVRQRIEEKGGLACYLS